MSKYLYIVASPIGNLEDISLRAINTLKKVELIFSEDTRVTRKLLTHLGLNKNLASLHKFNEKKQLSNLESVFTKYKKIALISDAGTPLVSDPGAYLLNYAYNNDIKIVPIPGPSSLSTAISVSGFSDNKNILFLSFLPHRITQVKKVFNKLLYYDIDSIVFYESAKRVKNSLEVLLEVFPKASIIVCREMTKIYEEYIHINNIKDINKLTLKGEYTITCKLNHEVKKRQNYNEKLSKNLANYLNINQKKAYNVLIKLKEEYNNVENN